MVMVMMMMTDDWWWMTSAARSCGVGIQTSFGKWMMLPLKLLPLRKTHGHKHTNAHATHTHQNCEKKEKHKHIKHTNLIKFISCIHMFVCIHMHSPPPNQKKTIFTTFHLPQTFPIFTNDSNPSTFPPEKGGKRRPNNGTSLRRPLYSSNFSWYTSFLLFKTSDSSKAREKKHVESRNSSERLKFFFGAFEKKS